MKTSVGIIGGSGYVGGELIRTIKHHPKVHLKYVYSTTYEGQNIACVHQDLIGDEMAFTGIHEPVDVVFLCAGHGHSEKILCDIEGKAKYIVDLSADFRWKADFQYGLVDHFERSISKSAKVANPGCFATAIQLGSLPLLQMDESIDRIDVHGITGATGAGKALSQTSHFPFRDNNVSMYKGLTHQHIEEVLDSIEHLTGKAVEVNFVPIRGNFSRGILVTVYMDTEEPLDDILNLYQSCYSTTGVFVTDCPIHLKQVVNTNKTVISIEKVGSKALIAVAIDNLLKGAAGQAIQNMNLMLGLSKDEGLKFKANYY